MGTEVLTLDQICMPSGGCFILQLHFFDADFRNRGHLRMVDAPGPADRLQRWTCNIDTPSTRSLCDDLGHSCVLGVESCLPVSEPALVFLIVLSDLTSDLGL